MKRCPQCNSVYTDETHYCLNDGQPLISEIFPLPSELGADNEQETLIHHDPIVVDLSGPGASFGQEIPQSQIPTAQSEVVVVKVPSEGKSNIGKYLIFLLTGLVLGGGLVLATLFLVYSFYRPDDAATTSGETNSNQTQNADNSAKTSEPAANKNRTANGEHLERTSAPDTDFNGRVITLNAYVRASPGRSSKEVDILPVGDRLTIKDRENENSPWYRVVCEHGTAGWMHGNTIEFTR